MSYVNADMTADWLPAKGLAKYRSLIGYCSEAWLGQVRGQQTFCIQTWSKARHIPRAGKSLSTWPRQAINTKWHVC